MNLNLSDGMGLTAVRVRQALSLGIDRDSIVENVVNGAGTVATGWLAPQTPGHDDSAPAFEHDVEKA